MIALPTYSGETAILGLGRSGLAALAALLAAGNRVVAWDDAKAPRAKAREMGAEIRDLYKDFGAPARLIVSPGVPLTHPTPHPLVAAARAAGAEVLGDMDLFADALAHAGLDGGADKAMLIGITGTNGKSTTTALVTHMLQAAGRTVYQGGNIGLPVLELPLEAGAAYVLELSSYQLDLNRRFGVDIGVWLNLTPDHLERHGDMAGYAAAKANLFANGKAAQLRVIGVDEEAGRALAQSLAKDAAMLMKIGAENADITYLADAFVVEGETIGLADCVALPGAHNAQNAAAAFAVGRAMGLSADTMRAAFKSFSGMAHRFQLIAAHEAVKFVNDSKATNMEATRHALAAYNNIYWIAGGRAKAAADGGLNIDMLTPYFGNVRGAYLIGEAARPFAAALADALPTTISETLDKAVADAAMQAMTDRFDAPVVLLSPACASFDQYEDFEARGAAFSSAVSDWIEAEETMSAEGRRAP